MSLLPFADHLYRVKLTGRQLKDVLEFSGSALLSKEEGASPSEDRLHPGEFLQLSGLRVVYDLSKTPSMMKGNRWSALGDRLRSVEILKDGTWGPLDDETVYTVAASGWMSVKGGANEYPALKDAPKEDTNILDSEAFIDYFTTVCGGNVKMECDGRITVENP